MNTIPSELDVIYWSHTDEDIATTANLKLGIEKAKSTEFTQSLCFIAGAIFGSKKPRPLQNEQEALAAFSGVFGKNAVVSYETDAFAGLDDVFEKMDKK